MVLPNWLKAGRLSSELQLSELVNSSQGPDSLPDRLEKSK